jgi:hypothetical protein
VECLETSFNKRLEFAAEARLWGRSLQHPYFVLVISELSDYDIMVENYAVTISFYYIKLWREL